MTPDTSAFDAVVLAGGAATRLGGVDKPALVVGGLSLLARAAGACAGAGCIVVVGPRRDDVPDGLVWAREDPPGGGPAAALCAGLGRVDAPVVLVVAADLPFVAQPTVRTLLAALQVSDDADGVLLTDADRRDQPLLAAYRTGALREAARALGGGHGAPLRRLLAPLRLLRLPDTDGASFDCDTWERVAEARIRLDGVRGG